MFIEQPILKVVKQQEKEAREHRESIGAKTVRSNKGSSITNSVSRARKQDSTSIQKQTIQTQRSVDKSMTSNALDLTSLTVQQTGLNQNALKELETSLDSKPVYKVEQYFKENQQRVFNKKASIQSNDNSMSSAASRKVSRVKPKIVQRDKTPQTSTTQKEFIEKFGTQKGQQYYGAIRELEEFLDPGVLNDDDFKINQKTVDDINSVHANILEKNSIEHSQDISIFDRGLQGPFSQNQKKRVSATYSQSRFPGPTSGNKVQDSRMSRNKYVDMTQSTDFEYANIPPLKNPLSIESSITRKKKKRQFQNGHTDDMLLMNLRMKMATQGGQSRVPNRPIQAHTYGFNDSAGDLRQNNNPGQKLIYDPQNTNRNPIQQQQLRANGFITPNIIEKKQYAIKSSQKGRHKSVNQRNGQPIYNTNNQGGLPKINQFNTNSNSLTKVTSSISKKPTPIPFALTDMMQTKGSSNNFNSNKPSLAPQDEIVSQRQQFQPIATPSTPLRHGDGPSGQFNQAYDYQLTQDNRMKRVNKTPGVGKIILKKINHFTDNIKLNKTYKNENLYKLEAERNVKGAKKSKMQQYDDLTFNDRRGSHFYQKEAELRDVKKYKSVKTSEKKMQQNIYMNQDQYKGLIQILEQQNKILKNISPDEMIEGKQELPEEMLTTGDKEQNHININIETSNGLPSPANHSKGKTQLDSQRIIRKGAQTAPRGVKRPSLPAVPLNHFNANVIKIQQENQNVFNYLNQKMRGGGETYFSHSNIKQYQEAAEKNYDAAYLKKQTSKGKKNPLNKKTMEVIRNKSAPKRKRLEDVQRSMPNQQQMNKLVQKTFKEKKFQDDEILNIKIKNKSRQRSQESMNLPKQISNGNQIIDDHRRISTNNKKSRKAKSPGQASGQYQFKQVKNAARLNINGETIDSHRTIVVPQPLKNKVQPSMSSIYGVGRNNLSRSYLSQSQQRREFNNSQSQRSIISSRSKRSNVQSEFSRMNSRNFGKSRQQMNLDQRNLALLQEPENIRNVSLFTPEGYSTDHKRDLENFSNAKYKQYERAESLYPTKSNSAQGMMKKGLKYKFSLKDLSKYSKNLKYKDINWKLQLSALGKKIPDIKERKKILIKGSHFNTLLKLLKNTDWSRTPVFHQFLRNGRWKHEDDCIYSEIELKYNISYINRFVEGMNATEIKEKYQDEQKMIAEKYYNKTMHTLEVLMNQLNMMYFWEKIRLMFIDQDPSLIQLQKLMGRAIKCYNMIDNFIKIFKLIKKKESLDEKKESDVQLCKRLKISIKLLLKENPVLPNTFNYKGKCLLETIQKELVLQGVEEETEAPTSPNKKELKIGREMSSDSRVLALSPGQDPFDVDSLQDGC